MQKLSTPLVDADLILTPQTRGKAVVMPDYCRTLALMQGRQGNDLRTVQLDRNGAIVEGKQDHAGWTWVEGNTTPATVFTPFTGIDYDFISLMCFEGIGIIRLFDLNDNIVEYAHATMLGTDAATLVVCRDTFNLKARKFVVNSVGSPIDLIYYLAGRRPA